MATAMITDTGLKERQSPNHICQQCGNMLWDYRNDPDRNNQLVRVCRTPDCKKEEVMESNLVYVNEVKFDGGVSTVATSDMVKDPTLPLADNVDCTSCHGSQAVFFQKPMKGDEGMKLIFMCIKCAHRWEQ